MGIALMNTLLLHLDRKVIHFWVLGILVVYCLPYNELLPAPENKHTTAAPKNKDPEKHIFF